jgi:hypothetical protein
VGGHKGFTFGGFAQASWRGEDSVPYDRNGAGDFLFRLGRDIKVQPWYDGVPTIYSATGDDTGYQWRDPSWWPMWGSNGDLNFGYKKALGDGGHCDQGLTYRGHKNDACGSDGSWGATEMEVWYRSGGS